MTVGYPGILVDYVVDFGTCESTVGPRSRPAGTLSHPLFGPLCQIRFDPMVRGQQSVFLQRHDDAFASLSSLFEPVWWTYK